jgi:hypothetical protein
MTEFWFDLASRISADARIRSGQVSRSRYSDVRDANTLVGNRGSTKPHWRFRLLRR